MSGDRPRISASMAAGDMVIRRDITGSSVGGRGGGGGGGGGRVNQIVMCMEFISNFIHNLTTTPDRRHGMWHLCTGMLTQHIIAHQN